MIKLKRISVILLLFLISFSIPSSMQIKTHGLEYNPYIGNRISDFEGRCAVTFGGRTWIRISETGNTFITVDRVSDRNLGGTNYTNSDLRKWLNNDFLNTLDKNYLIQTEWSTDTENGTDYVRLLQSNELEPYAYIVGFNREFSGWTMNFMYNGSNITSFTSTFYVRRSLENINGRREYVSRFYAHSSSLNSNISPSVYPVITFSNNVRINGGKGSENEPFTLTYLPECQIVLSSPVENQTITGNTLTISGTVTSLYKDYTLHLFYFIEGIKEPQFLTGIKLNTTTKNFSINIDMTNAPEGYSSIGIWGKLIYPTVQNPPLNEAFGWYYKEFEKTIFDLNIFNGRSKSIPINSKDYWIRNDANKITRLIAPYSIINSAIDQNQNRYLLVKRSYTYYLLKIDKDGNFQFATQVRIPDKDHLFSYQSKVFYNNNIVSIFSILDAGEYAEDVMTSYFFTHQYNTNGQLINSKLNPIEFKISDNYWFSMIPTRNIHCMRADNKAIVSIYYTYENSKEYDYYTHICEIGIDGGKVIGGLQEDMYLKEALIVENSPNDYYLKVEYDGDYIYYINNRELMYESWEWGAGTYKVIPARRPDGSIGLYGQESGSYIGDQNRLVIYYEKKYNKYYVDRPVPFTKEYKTFFEYAGQNKFIYFAEDDSKVYVIFMDMDFNVIERKEYPKDLVPANLKAAWFASTKKYIDPKHFVLIPSGTTIDLNVYTFNIPPQISIVSPTNHQYLGDNTNITFTVNVNDIEGDRFTVSSNINGIIKTVSNASNATFTYNTSEIGEGKFSNITFTAKDNDGESQIVWTQTLDIRFILTELDRNIDTYLPKHSNLARVIAVNADNRKLDDNASNRKLINQIKDKLTERNVGLYFVGANNSLTIDLASYFE